MTVSGSPSSGRQLALVADMRRRLSRMPAQRTALTGAIRDHFGPDLDEQAFTRAFTSDDPADIRHVIEVTGLFGGLVNHCVELIKDGVRHNDLRPVEEEPGAPGGIETMHRDGGLSADAAATLKRLNRMRNALEHASPDVQPDELRADVHDLMSLLPRFTKNFVEWMARHGVNLQG